MSQAMATYWPHKKGGQEEYRFIEGKNRDDILWRAQEENPDSKKFFLAHLHARIGHIRGPVVWTSGKVYGPEDDWLSAADGLIPA